jgi:hypothetical protein
MTLPPLALQIVFAHLAWGCVTAAVAVMLLSRMRTLETWQVVAVTALAFIANGPLGVYSLSYWLGLCFQSPSSLLVFCSVLVVWRCTRGMVHIPLLPTPLAAAIAVTGALLYVDTAGWLPFSLYANGFGGVAAIAALSCSALAFWAVLQRMRRDLAMAVLLSFTLFAVWRLPTGNAWDAVLDPLLWGWAVACCIGRAARAWRRRRSTPALARA